MHGHTWAEIQLRRWTLREERLPDMPSLGTQAKRPEDTLIYPDTCRNSRIPHAPGTQEEVNLLTHLETLGKGPRHLDKLHYK